MIRWNACLSRGVLFPLQARTVYTLMSNVIVVIVQGEFVRGRLVGVARRIIFGRLLEGF